MEEILSSVFHPPYLNPLVPRRRLFTLHVDGLPAAARRRVSRGEGIRAEAITPVLEKYKAVQFFPINFLVILFLNLKVL